jgi:predicted nucleic acid-binding protein
MSPPARRGLTLDTGALIQLERGDPRVRSLLRRAVGEQLPISVPAGAVAQAWRGGPRQARVARLLADPVVRVVVLDDPTARAVGLLAGRCGHSDVVDVSVVLCALERDDTVVTTDPDDISSVSQGVATIAL